MLRLSILVSVQRMRCRHAWHNYLTPGLYSMKRTCTINAWTQSFCSIVLESAGLWHDWIQLTLHAPNLAKFTPGPPWGKGWPTRGRSSLPGWLWTWSTTIGLVWDGAIACLTYRNSITAATCSLKPAEVAHACSASRGYIDHGIEIDGHFMEWVCSLVSCDAPCGIVFSSDIYKALKI